MGLYMIFLILAYLLCVQVLGLLVLRFVPQFRVTIGNLVLFVVGATAGMFGLVNFVLRTFDVYRYVPVTKEGELTVFLAFPGALIGGTVLVGLKMLLLRRGTK